MTPVNCSLIKMFDQLKNSRHDLIFIADVFWLFQNAVIFISGLILMGIKNKFLHLVAKRQMHFVLTFGRTSGGWGWVVASSDPSEVFLSIFLDGKTSAPDVFNRFSFFPRTHFETSLVMVNYYRYEI